jgi:NTP pyrophosphatase (non-canonical NTP hydrolase)
MQSEEYQRVIKTFLEEGTTEETLFTGLAAEVGEVMSERVKETRTGAERSEEILDELSDILWYVATIASARGSSLEDLMTHNTCKLITRTLYGK